MPNLVPLHMPMATDAERGAAAAPDGFSLKDHEDFRRVETGAAIALMNKLRIVGLRCRSARKAPPIEACQLLLHDVPETAALDLLMRSLPQALGKMPVFYAPGTTELSFDEAWLVNLIRALRAGDTSSSAFLLRSRVPSYARRSLVLLLRAALPDL